MRGRAPSQGRSEHHIDALGAGDHRVVLGGRQGDGHRREYAPSLRRSEQLIGGGGAGAPRGVPGGRQGDGHCWPHAGRTRRKVQSQYAYSLSPAHEWRLEGGNTYGL